MKRVAIIGCGALGTTLMRIVQERLADRVVLSGAVGGFDVLRTMAMQSRVEITIDNAKAPRSLNGAPYLGGCALPEDAGQTVFDGTAREAIAGFPKNVNVAVASALAAGEMDGARVVINSRPGMTDNLHRVLAHSALADVEMTFRSRPDSENPRSSVITAYSAAAFLEQLDSPIRFF